MAYLRRKVDYFLEEWKADESRKPLILKGARQVGKTESIRHFGERSYEHLIEINFVEEPKYKMIIEDGFKAEDIIKNISRIDPSKEFAEGNTLIFFDELQEFPEIVTSLKFFSIDGRFDVICSGSMLGIQYKRIESNSVGYKTDYQMYSMDFEEFLWAMGDEVMMPYILSQFEKKKPMGAFHRMAMDYFRQYMIVGGMPQAVKKYVETRDFEKVDEVKRDILALYRNDIKKYADNQETKVSAIFEEIPSQLQKHEKKFRLSTLRDDARMRDYSQAFFWLSDARVVNCCYNSTEPSIGLKLNEDRTTVKCYLNDTGLLISHAFDERGIVSEDLYRKLMFDKLEINQGMLVENIVAQMLKAAGHNLFFFSNNSRTSVEDRMEIDFLIAKPTTTSRHNISPVEVKSGSRYTLTSLTKCIAKYAKDLSTPYVLHDKDVKVENGIVFLPLYMTPLL